jgi:predicted amidohydrolase
VKIGCLQMAVARGDVGANLDTLRRLLPAASEAGVELLLLPEMWSGGFAYREMPKVAAETPGILDQLRLTAAAGGPSIAGSMPEAVDGRLHNTLYLTGADGVAAAYRKIHLFPPFKEDDFLDAGKHLCLADVGGLKIGLAICFDLRFPELFRKLALKGAELLLVSGQWPVERLDHWRVLVRARAIENQIWVAACNTHGKTGKTHFAGHSMIVDPAGAIVAEAGDGEELVTAEIDPGRVAAERARIDYLACRVRELDEFLNLT